MTPTRQPSLDGQGRARKIGAVNGAHIILPPQLETLTLIDLLTFFFTIQGQNLTIITDV